MNAKEQPVRYADCQNDIATLPLSLPRLANSSLDRAIYGTCVAKKIEFADLSQGAVSSDFMAGHFCSRAALVTGPNRATVALFDEGHKYRDCIGLRHSEGNRAKRASNFCIAREHRLTILAAFDCFPRDFDRCVGHLRTRVGRLGALEITNARRAGYAGRLKGG
jgi:hypothetical protein